MSNETLIGSDGWFNMDDLPEIKEIAIGGWIDFEESETTERVSYMTDGWYRTDGVVPGGEELFTFGFYKGVTSGNSPNNAAVNHYYNLLRKRDELP